MTGAGEPSAADAPTLLTKGHESCSEATEAVQTTGRSIADAVEAGRRPGAAADRLASLTRGAPLQSLSIAFLVGFIIARRHQSAAQI
jgi:hypothetical protein